MARTLFLLALGVTFVTAAVTDCKYDAVASQADDQDTEYEYCTLDGDQLITTTGQNSPAKLTVDVGGKHGECLSLAPDLTDQQLDDQLGLKTRPRYKGQFSQSGDDITFTLDQFGNSDVTCAYIQRHIELDWGEDYCVNAQDPSQGIVHDIYFNDAAACTSFAALTAAQRKNQVENSFSDYADEMIDSWALATAFAEGLNITLNYVVDDKVLTRSFTQDEEYTPSTSLCYGVGDAYAAPYLIPVLTNTSLTDYVVENHIHAPGNGYVCGYDCTDDVDTAYGVFQNTLIQTGNAQMAVGAGIASVGNSMCGVMYGINGTTGPAEYAGLPSLRAFIVGMMILGVGADSPCDVCQYPAPGAGPSFSAFDVFGRLTTVSEGEIPGADAAAKYTFCQPGVVMQSVLYLRHSGSHDNDFSMTDISACQSDGTTTSGASAVSALLAVVASLFVAMRMH